MHTHISLKHEECFMWNENTLTAPLLETFVRLCEITTNNCIECDTSKHILSINIYGMTIIYSITAKAFRYQNIQHIYFSLISENVFAEN